jgi:large subunit ribosomal protein L23
MSDHFDVIVAPVMTEKSTESLEASNVYTFIVKPNATKGQIRSAVETLWDVTVQDVRTMRYAGKMKRSFLGQMAKSRQVGRRPAFKKAMVQLNEGDHIEFYEIG